MLTTDDMAADDSLAKEDCLAADPTTEGARTGGCCRGAAMTHWGDYPIVVKSQGVGVQSVTVVPDHPDVGWFILERFGSYNHYDRVDSTVQGYCVGSNHSVELSTKLLSRW